MDEAYYCFRCYATFGWRWLSKCKICEGINQPIPRAAKFKRIITQKQCQVANCLQQFRTNEACGRGMGGFWIGDVTCIIIVAFTFVLVSQWAVLLINPGWCVPLSEPFSVLLARVLSGDLCSGEYRSGEGEEKDLSRVSAWFNRAKAFFSTWESMGPVALGLV